MKKRFICVLLVMIMCFSSVTAYASDETPNVLIDTVERSLQHIINISTESEYYLGAKINSYSLECDGIVISDSELYPIYENNEIVAFTNVVQDSNGYVSASFNTTYVDAFNSYLRDNISEELAVLYAKDGVYILDSVKELHLIYAWDDSSLESIDLDSIQDMAFVMSCVEQCYPFVPNQTLVQSRLVRKLGCSRVNNPKNYCSHMVCKTGICWAASMAIIVNYYKGLSKTAEQIHDETGLHGFAVEDYFMQKLSQLYGVSSSGFVTSISGNEVKTRINSNYLMFTRLAIELINGHMVVIHGYSEDSAGVSGVWFMDPNCGSTYQALNVVGQLTTVITQNGKEYFFDYCFSTSG